MNHKTEAARIAALEAELVSYKLERTMRQMAEAANSEYLKQLAAAKEENERLKCCTPLPHLKRNNDELRQQLTTASQQLDIAVKVLERILPMAGGCYSEWCAKALSEIRELKRGVV